jgi:hypothetical protein
MWYWDTVMNEYFALMGSIDCPVSVLTTTTSQYPQKTTELFRISILYCHKYMNIECMRMIFYCLSITCMLQMISYFSYLFYNITKWSAHWLGGCTLRHNPLPRLDEYEYG